MAKGLISSIISIIIALIMFVLGASGKYVLRGTNSSGALMLFAFALLAYGIYSLAKALKSQ